MQQKKWYVLNDQINLEYGEGNENDSSIKLKLSNEVFVIILVTRDITTGGDANTNIAFKNCAPFR